MSVDAPADGRDRHQPRRHARASGQAAARRRDASTRCWSGSASARSIARRATCSSTPRASCAPTCREVGYVTDLETLEQVPAERLELNDIGRVTISLSSAAILRPVQPEPRDRRVHPDRLDHEQHRRGGHDPGRGIRATRTRRARPRRASALAGQPLGATRAARSGGRHGMAHGSARRRARAPSPTRSSGGCSTRGASRS